MNTSQVLKQQIAQQQKEIEKLKTENKTLKKNETRYRTIFNNLNDAVGLHKITPDGISGFIDVNDTACKLSGYTREEFLQLQPQDFIPPEKQAELAEKLKEIPEKGYMKTETEHITKSGETKYMEVSMHIFDMQGEKYLINITRNITVQKQKDEYLHRINRELKERLKEFNCIYQLTQLVETNTSINGILEGLVPVMQKSWQYPEITAVRIRYKDLIHQSDNYRKTPWILSAPIKANNQKTGEIEIVYLKEKPQKYEGPFLKEERILLNLITERVEHIIDHKQKIKNYAELFNTLNEAILKADSAGIITEANKTAARICGYSGADEMIGMHMKNLYPQQKDRKKLLQKLKTRNNELRNYEFELKRKDGSTIWTLCNIQLLKNKQGEITGTLGAFRDITGRKNAEQALKQSEEKFRSFVENVNDIIYELTTDGYFIYVSQNWKGLLGHESKDVAGNHFSKYVHPEDINRCQKFLSTLIKTGKKQAGVEYRVKHKNGTWRWHMSNASPLKNKEGHIISYLGVARDITQRKTDELILKKAKDEQAALNEELKTSNEHLQNEIYEHKKTFEKLKQSEQRYRSLLENISDSVYVLDKNWKHVIVNDAAAKFTQISKDRLLNASLFDLFPGIENTRFFQAFKKAMQQRESMVVENEYHFPDGRKAWYQVNVYPVNEGILCISSDISERKKQNEQLKKTKYHLDKILETMLDGMVEVNTKGEIIYANTAAEKILEIKKDKIFGRYYNERDWKQIDLNHQPYPLEKLPLAIALSSGKEVNGLEHGIIAPNGQIKWLSVNAAPLFNEKKEIIGAIASFRDISEAKKAEKALKNSETRLKKIVENMPVMLDAFDENYKIIAWNKECEKVTGYTAEEIRNHPSPMNLLYPDKDYLDKITRELIENDFTFRGKEWTLTAKDGSERTIIWNNNSKQFPIEGWGFWATGIDITEQKKTQKALKDSEEKFRAVFENSLTAIVIADDKGNYISVNDAAADMFGYSKKELLNMNVTDLRTPNPNQTIDQYQTYLQKGKETGEFYFINKKGESRVAQFHAIRIKPDFNLSILTDITERKIAEKALKDSEEKHRTVLDNVQEGIFVLQGDRVVFTNPAIRNITGYSKKEIKKLKFIDAVYKDDRKLVLENYNKRLQGKKIPTYDMRIVSKTGKVRWFSLNATKIQWKGKDADLVFVQDINERKEAEQALMEREKQLRHVNATKDKFFTILSHDLKNPLNGIIGFSKLVQSNLEKRNYQKAERFTKIISRTSEQTMALLSNLLDWSRTQRGKVAFEPEKIDMRDLIEEVAEFIDSTARQKNIFINTSQIENCFVYADRNMMQTIIRNLLTNAIKFTHPGGKVEVRAEKSANETIISVSDTGIGMTKETAENLFSITDTYSKKGTNNEKGTGLGLILCKEFVEKHKGKIWVQSQPGTGSTFYFSLPVL